MLGIKLGLTRKETNMSDNRKNGFLIVDSETEIYDDCRVGRVFIANYKASGKSAIAIRKNGVFGIHIEDEEYTPLPRPEQ